MVELAVKEKESMKQAELQRELASARGYEYAFDEAELYG